MENNSKQVISTDLAAEGEDYTVASPAGTDFSYLENRLAALCISAEMFAKEATSESAAAHFYRQHTEELAAINSRFQQRLQNFAQQLVRQLMPVKRLVSDPKAVSKVVSGRKRKRALQSRYSYGRRTLTWVMPSTESRRVSSAQTHTSQVPKHSYSPTGRLNTTLPAEQHVPKKIAGLLTP